MKNLNTNVKNIIGGVEHIRPMNDDELELLLLVADSEDYSESKDNESKAWLNQYMSSGYINIDMFQ